MQVAQLLFVVSVDESHKLVCQAPGCGRAVAKAVHVIRDETSTIRVVGSGCYEKLAGHRRATDSGASIAGFDGRRLSSEERALMVADTAAFVAQIEARLAAEQVAAETEQRQQAVARRLREGQAASVAPTFSQSSRGEWRRPVVEGPEGMQRGERHGALDQLARFRAQQARQAARIAMQRRPELAAHALETVADAMAQAKSRYLSRGLRMDAPDARESIESEAVALLAEQARGSTAD